MLLASVGKVLELYSMRPPVFPLHGPVITEGPDAPQVGLELLFEPPFFLWCNEQG